MQTLKEAQIEAIRDYLITAFWSQHWDFYRFGDDVMGIIEEEEVKYRLKRQEADELSHD